MCGDGEEGRGKREENPEEIFFTCVIFIHLPLNGDL